MKVVFVFFTAPPSPFSSSVAALAPVVRAAGHEPEARMVERTEAIEPVVRDLLARDADVIAVSSMTRDWPGARALLERLAPHTKAIRVVGGYHASLAPRDVAASAAVDAIVIGEGERPLVRLLEQLGAGAPLKSGPGLWARKGDRFDGAIPGADSEPDIADLPWWDYDLFGDMRAHLDRGVNTFGPIADRYLPVRASRGCPYSCAYCSAPAWGKLGGFAEKERRNRRPVDHLCAELESLVAAYDPEGFEFWDEHFPLDLDWLREFARTYPALVGRPFKVEMHPRAATRERLELLAEAGIALFHCGVEAGDADLRRTVLNRRTTDEQLQRVFDDCRALGIPTSASLMTTLPKESRAMAHSTVGLLRKLRPDSFMWSNYQALPGTVLGEAAVSHWPGPSGETFADHDPPAWTEAPPMSEAECAATFAEIRSLQLELVAAASENEDRPRPVDVPAPAKALSPESIAPLLGLDAGALVEAVAGDDGLLLTLERDDIGRATIVVAPRDEGRHYVTSRHLGLSYRGSEAPPALLRLLERMARVAGAVSMDQLLHTES